MIVYRNKRRMQEAVNLEKLADILPMKDARGKDPKQLYGPVLNYLRKGDGSRVDKFFKAYGTSKEEIMAAIKLLVKWYNGADIAEQMKLEKEFRKTFDIKGKIDRSNAIQLAKHVLENMEDDDFYLLTMMDDEDLEKFNYFDEDWRDLFNIDDDETKQALKDNKNKLRGVISKTGMKRNIKGAGKKLVNSVKDKVNKVKRAGAWLSGFFS